jgi:hypothetical protein
VLGTGYHHITAAYQGDPNFLGSTSPVLNQLVNQDGTTTALAASAGPAVAGQPLTLTATVAGVIPGFGPPTGQVLFLDAPLTFVSGILPSGGNGTSTLPPAVLPLTIGTGTLSGGVATFTTAALAPGFHSLSAIYVGDGNFTGSSTAAPLVEVLNNPAPVVASLSTAAVPEGSGAFTLTLTGTGFLPTSAVQWNGTPLPITAASGTQLQVTVPAALLTAVGTARVTVTNPWPGGGTSLPQTFTITDAPLTAGGRNIAVTGAKNFSGVVATFTDGNLFAVAGDFTAIIAWDDGTASFGTVSGTGPFTVSGSHRFGGFQNVHVVTVTVYDRGGGTATVTDNLIDPPGPADPGGAGAHRAKRRTHHHRHHRAQPKGLIHELGRLHRHGHRPVG